MKTCSEMELFLLFFCNCGRVLFERCPVVAELNDERISKILCVKRRPTCKCLCEQEVPVAFGQTYEELQAQYRVLKHFSFCAKCKKVLFPDDQFCGACGTEVKQEPCVCEHTALPGDKFCRHCGRSLTKDEQSF